MQSSIPRGGRLRSIDFVGEPMEMEVILTNATSEESPLSQLERLVAIEKYRKALEEIEILRKKNLSTGDRLRVSVLESQCLMDLGEFLLDDMIEPME